jgi:mycofactocin system creatininase family protein
VNDRTPATQGAHLCDLTSPEAGARSGHAILAVPLGATEQHGPHLPLTTDTDIAEALCTRLAQARGDVLVAPAVPYGSSGEHDGFPGTLSIGQEATTALVVELGRSAGRSFPSVLFVSAHGGNSEPVSAAVRLLRSESRDVALFQPRWEGDPHAGRPETSMLMALRPWAVRRDRIERGDLRPLAEVLPLLHQGGVAAVSGTGVLGDPRGAAAAEGTDLLRRIGDDLIALVEQWHPVGAP